MSLSQQETQPFEQETVIAPTTQQVGNLRCCRLGEKFTSMPTVAFKHFSLSGIVIHPYQHIGFSESGSRRYIGKQVSKPQLSGVGSALDQFKMQVRASVQLRDLVAVHGIYIRTQSP